MTRVLQHQSCPPSPISESCGYVPAARQIILSILHICHRDRLRAHLATEVLNLDRAALEGHREAALQLIFCSAELI